MITIYGKDNCKFCDAAIQICKMKSMTYTYLKLDEDYTKQELLEKFPSAKTFPQITMNGDHVGGFQELKKQLMINI